ncbi:MAG: hypothetical protein HDS68_01890 [Bacteroidales bacterium]|nr:hypothetical protein [Bacteroidales bacterium]
MKTNFRPTLRITLAAVVICAFGATATGRFELRSPSGRVAGTSMNRRDISRTASGADNGIKPMKISARATAPGTLPQKAKTTAESPSLMGLMIYSSGWGFGNSTGIYAIDATNGSTDLVCAFPEADGSGSVTGTIANGMFYGSYCEDFYGNISKLCNYTVDLASGKTETYTYTAPSYDDVAVNMTYDGSTGNIYAITYSGTTDYYDLKIFHPDTNSYTSVGELEEHFYAICSDSRGHLYAINDMGSVVEINPENGQTVGTVAETNIEPMYSQSCTWSPKDNLIYWAACNYTVASLITIDPATGTVATATDFPHDEEFVALSCTDPTENISAPAAPIALTVTYSTPGATDGKLHCTAPSLTVGGEMLTGTLTITVTSDGETIASGSVAPGAEFTADITLPEGAHKLTAFCSNSSGNGTRLFATTFTGTDRPATVTDLTAESNDTRTVILNWSAPGNGENGGWFDQSLLSYNVRRNGNVIAASIIETKFTDSLDDTFATNIYTVETLYGGEPCGLSNSVRANTGDHLALPYSNNFENDGDFDLLTVIDSNDDGNTWFHDDEYNTASYNYSRSMGGDDYLVLPLIQGEKDHVYHLDFFARSASMSYPEKMEVVCGTTPTANGLSHILMAAKTISNEGENLSVEYNHEEDGPLYIAFHCVSDADMSRLFVDDITIADRGKLSDPNAAENLKAVPAADGSQETTLTFTAPSTTLGGKALENIDHMEICRNGKLIHTIADPAPGSSHSYTDKEAEFGFNTYSVTAFANGSGANSASVKVFVGVYKLPFSITPTTEEYSLFTIPGGERDGTWYHDGSENALKITTYGNTKSDSYIFTPAIELTDANLVNLSFSYRGGLPSCTEALEVTFGTTPDPSTHQPVDYLEFNNTEYDIHTVRFPVEKAGRYYIGFHSQSEPDQMMMLIRDINLDRGSLMTTPAAAAITAVKGGEQGALTASVTFTLPNRTLEGKPLEGTIGAILYRADGTVASSADGLTPGENHTLTDENASQGINTYTVVTTNGDGNGGRAEASGWVGTDIPVHLPYLDALPSYDNLRAELSWDAPMTGLHGGWINPTALTYNIYQLQDNSLYLIATTDQNEITVMPQGGNVQDFYTFYVTAVSSAGESQALSTGLVVGPPHYLPMIETASNRIVTALPWISGPLEGDVNWGVADYIGSLDMAAADGGMFVCSAALPERRPGAARMQLPKLIFDGLNAPTLTFSMYHYAGKGGELQVSVTTDELTYTPVFTKTVNAESEGWKEYSVNLAQYSESPWVAIVFDGILTDGTTYVIVDDIEVANRSKYDVMISSINGSTSPEAGTDASYTVTVKNSGSEKASFDLEMRLNGVVETVLEGLTLEGGSTSRYQLAMAVLPEYINSETEVEIKAAMTGNTDEIPSNNTARFNVTVIQPELPVITDLTAEKSVEGVKLEWTAPSLAPEPITDNFCGYESFAYDGFGNYKTVDNDGLIPCGIQGVEFPNMGSPMAFQIWEPRAEGVDVDAEIWQPRSGNKCLVAWTALSSYTEPFNDDWLISPELYVSDTPQEMSFFVRRPVSTYGAESFEILYSTDGDEPEDFTLLKSETITNGVWNKCSYELPAGARHFAIRYVSRNRFALLFDDLTYTRASTRSELRVEGFNVMRNGIKIGSTGMNGNSFTDPETNDNAAYNVTVVYDRGESGKSNTARLTAGVTDVTIGSGIAIEGHKGFITVSAPEGTVVKVTAADGRTAYMGEAKARIELPSGVYVVEAGSFVEKVAVK